MGNKYLVPPLPRLSSCLLVHHTFVHFPFLHSICLNLDYFLYAEKSRNTASNIPQMIRSGFLTFHLTTLDEMREEMNLSKSAAGCNYGTIHSFKR